MLDRMLSKKSWIIPTLLILFILQVATLPFVIKYTYSGRSESPDHVVTYTTSRLEWDKGTVVSKNGVAKLSLFDTYYSNVKSGNGDKVLAPGTEGDSIIRLKNSTNRTVTYKAVIYEEKNQDTLNVVTNFSGVNFKETDNYSLPKGAEGSRVIAAVEGSLEQGRIQDFNIDWVWAFEDNDEVNKIDTALGNKKFNKSTEDVVVGFYIVVDDKGEVYRPVPTGDETLLWVYILIMVVSGVILLASLFTSRKERESEDE